MSTLQDPVFFSGKDGSLIPGQECFFKKLEAELKKKAKNVVLIGENHEDPCAHQLELKILQKVASLRPTKDVALSLEFYDRSAQPLLNEYLLGVIDYETFIGNCAEAPGNHADYKPLIDFCKEQELPVIASNCSRRHTRLMVNKGPEGVARLAANSEIHRTLLLPPLPIQPASEAYASNFRAIMGIVRSDNVDDSRISRMLNAQTMWDATMADSIVKTLLGTECDIVVHVAGFFHVQHNLGIPEHLVNYSKDSELDYHRTTVVILPEEELEFVETEHKDKADFLILTDMNGL